MTDKEKKCVSDGNLYTSLPAQLKCINCGRYWIEGYVVPDCVATPPQESEVEKEAHRVKMMYRPFIDMDVEPHTYNPANCTEADKYLDNLVELARKEGYQKGKEEGLELLETFLKGDTANNKALIEALDKGIEILSNNT